MNRFLFSLILGSVIFPAIASAEQIDVRQITEWKLVYGQVETRDRVPARARIGGTTTSLDVSEGDRVAAGERVAMIEDAKLIFQIDAIAARLEALSSRLETARSDLIRGEQLMERGVITSQRLEALQTAVNVLEGEMSSLDAERLVVEQQIEEGGVFAPEAGIVLSVPISLGSVVVPGDAIAVVGGGGVFLRLAVPERHAEDLVEGDTIKIGGTEGIRTGTLAKIYPQIEGGRVQADVDVEGLDAGFIGRRVPVRLPVGTREAILVPQSTLSKAGGLDFVTVETEEGTARRVVVTGAAIDLDGAPWREILSGLDPTDNVVSVNE